MRIHPHYWEGRTVKKRTLLTIANTLLAGVLLATVTSLLANAIRLPLWGILLLLGLLLAGIIPITVSLLTLPPDSTDQSLRAHDALLQTTPAAICKGLICGGEVEWVQRPITDAKHLYDHARILIVGPAGCGKTRAAAQLIQYLIDVGRLPGLHIYQPGDGLRRLSGTALASSLGPFLLPEWSALLFFDELLRTCQRDTFQNVDQALAALEHCKAGFVIATARPDDRSGLIAWLEAQSPPFDIIRLADLNADQMGEVLDNASRAFDISVDPTARAHFLTATDRRPELVIRTLLNLCGEGIRHLDEPTAARAVQSTVELLWEQARCDARDRIPGAGPLLDALADFHAARINPYTSLVCHYAASLWPHARPFPGLRLIPGALRRAVALLRALAHLEYLNIKDDGFRICYQDITFDGPTPDDAARRRIEVFLTHHRRFLHNRFLSGMYLDADYHLLALNELAVSAQHAGDHAAADRLCSRALRIRRDAIRYANRAAFRQIWGHNREAIDDASKAIRLSRKDDDRAYAHFIRAVAQAAEADPPGAIADYAEAIRQHSNADLKALAYLGRGQSCTEEDRPDEIADYTEAVRLFTTDVLKGWAYFNRASARAAEGDHPSAIDDYTEAIRLWPDGTEKALAYFNRALSHALEGDRPNSICDLTEAIRLFSDDADKAKAYFCRAFIHADNRDHNRAITDFADAVRLFRDPVARARAYLNRGAVRAVQGDRAGAIEDLTEAICLYPTGPEKTLTFYTRGLLRTLARDCLGAIDDFSECMDLFPDDSLKALACYCRARAQALIGQAQDACDSLVTAISLNPWWGTFSFTNSDFDAIRAEPSFQVMVAQGSHLDSSTEPTGK